MCSLQNIVSKLNGHEQWWDMLTCPAQLLCYCQLDQLARARVRSCRTYDLSFMMELDLKKRRLIIMTRISTALPHHPKMHWALQLEEHHGRQLWNEEETRPNFQGCCSKSKSRSVKLCQQIQIKFQDIGESQHHIFSSADPWVHKNLFNQSSFPPILSWQLHHLILRQNLFLPLWVPILLRRK